MSKFKVGDKVIRTIDFGGELTVGYVGSVSKVHDAVLRLEGLGGWYSENNFELHNTNHHPHHDVIIAWAKGAKVQSSFDGDFWCESSCPAWLLSELYRVKPEPIKTEREIRIENLKVELDNLLSEEV